MRSILVLIAFLWAVNNVQRKYLLSISATCLCLMSCVEQKKTETILMSQLELSDTDIADLLELLEVDNQDTLNFHILYSEHLNDSTAIIEISYNNRLPFKEIDFCSVLKFQSSNVFIYKEGCDNTIPVEFTGKNDQSPFFIPDAPHWMVLVKKRNSGVAYFRIDHFVNYNENLESPFPEYSQDY